MLKSEDVQPFIEAGQELSRVVTQVSAFMEGMSVGLGVPEPKAAANSLRKAFNSYFKLWGNLCELIIQDVDDPGKESAKNSQPDVDT